MLPNVSVAQVPILEPVVEAQPANAEALSEIHPPIEDEVFVTQSTIDPAVLEAHVPIVSAVLPAHSPMLENVSEAHVPILSLIPVNHSPKLLIRLSPVSLIQLKISTIVSLRPLRIPRIILLPIGSISFAGE